MLFYIFQYIINLLFDNKYNVEINFKNYNYEPK